MLLTCAEYCITEDYALSLSFKAAGFKGAYMVSFVTGLLANFICFIHLALCTQ